MSFTDVCEDLKKAVEYNFSNEVVIWLKERIHHIIEEKSTKDLFLTYSLLASKVNGNDELLLPKKGSNVFTYLENHKAMPLQVSRVYLLVKVLEADTTYFTPKVSNIIQVADTKELETFLKYLILLPNPEDYTSTAVDALRTNIVTVFDAIALNNPYPTQYFNDQQWNQMYLKTAFMERDISMIMDIDDRANKELARIISDYAHERWAASREIEPYFWRPVSKFLDSTLLKDMEKLFKSSNKKENMAAGLCCSNSKFDDAKKLLDEYPIIKQKIAQNLINWKHIK
tara:strand:+ start:9039 stop:9893 length:855 start_codon:yes stop_codon:yes gene_type:complete